MGIESQEFPFHLRYGTQNTGQGFSALIACSSQLDASAAHVPKQPLVSSHNMADIHHTDRPTVAVSQVSKPRTLHKQDNERLQLCKLIKISLATQLNAATTISVCLACYSGSNIRPRPPDKTSHLPIQLSRSSESLLFYRVTLLNIKLYK